MQLVRTQCLQQLSQLRVNPVTLQLHWSVVFSIRFFLFQRMEEGVTIEEGIGDTNMLEIVLVELVGISIVFFFKIVIIRVLTHIRTN